MSFTDDELLLLHDLDLDLEGRGPCRPGLERLWWAGLVVGVLLAAFVLAQVEVGLDPRMLR
jgi:hypothetical protein